MHTTLTLHTQEIEQRLARCTQEALRSAGEAAVALTRHRMLSGYERPVYRTGALLRDVSFFVEGDAVTIGNTLPYARFVHDGTGRMPGRPYLAEAILSGANPLEDAVRTAYGR